MVKMKATKLQALEFFLKMKLAETFQRERKFGFSRNYAHNVQSTTAQGSSLLSTDLCSSERLHQQADVVTA